MQVLEVHQISCRSKQILIMMAVVANWVECEEERDRKAHHKHRQHEQAEAPKDRHNCECYQVCISSIDTRCRFGPCWGVHNCEQTHCIIPCETSNGAQAVHEQNKQAGEYLPWAMYKVANTNRNWNATDINENWMVLSHRDSSPTMCMIPELWTVHAPGWQRAQNSTTERGATMAMQQRSNINTTTRCCDSPGIVGRRTIRKNSKLIPVA